MYYASIGLLAALILIIENHDILFRRTGVRENPALKLYRSFLYAVLVYYITDVLWGVLDLYKAGAFFRKNSQSHVWRQTRSLRELGGKKVTVLGAGSIAAEISKRFRAMGCTVTALCRHPEPSPDFDRVTQISWLDERLPETDIMVLAAPLNEGTYHIFNAERFAKLKPGSIFVNIARGGLVETQAFIEAMESGRLYGAVMDVFETEPLPEDSPIWDMENVIVTPHNSFSGENNGHRTFEIIHRDLQQWLQENK